MFSNFYLTKGAYLERMAKQQNRKLKILCLHGYNGNARFMEHQMRHFKQIFSEVMEFVLIDAPFKCQDEPMRETKKFLDTPSSHFK